MLIIKKDDFVYRGEVQNDLPHGVGHYTNFDKKGGYEYNG